MLEVVGSNFGGGRKGALFGLYEVEEGYMRCVFCVMCWYVVGVGFGVRGGVGGSGVSVWGV